MNKHYLSSLGRYLLLNTFVYATLSMIMGPASLGAFIGCTVMAVAIHHFFLYER